VSLTRKIIYKKGYFFQKKDKNQRFKPYSIRNYQTQRRKKNYVKQRIFFFCLCECETGSTISVVNFFN
jgi:hypothetical protein